MTIDAHQHFWDIARGDYDWLTQDLGSIYRNFLPQDLKPILDALGIKATIAVQAAETLAETQFLLDIAQDHDWVIGVVGWVDFDDARVVDQIAAFSQNPKFIGVRPMIQSIQDTNWILGDQMHDGVKELIQRDISFDALVKPPHLDALITFLDRYPDLRVIVDHCAKPRIDLNEFDDWARKVTDIAHRPNTFCKLSGLMTEAGTEPSFEKLHPYMSHIQRCFGHDRILFGSDWPVMTLAGTYHDWWDHWSKIAPDNAEEQSSAATFCAYPRLNAK